MAQYAGGGSGSRTGRTWYNPKTSIQPCPGRGKMSAGPGRNQKRGGGNPHQQDGWDVTARGMDSMGAGKEGRYWWRHYQVLRVIAEASSPGISLSKRQIPAKCSFAFVKAGEKLQQHTNPTGRILATAWTSSRRLTWVNRSNSQTRALTWFLFQDQSSRQVVLLELTVPWEDWMGEVFERKRVKYEELTGECRSRG